MYESIRDVQNQIRYGRRAIDESRQALQTE
jgi:hypothetical protein